jgi:hypothetical protein
VHLLIVIEDGGMMMRRERKNKMRTMKGNKKGIRSYPHGDIKTK